MSKLDRSMSSTIPQRLPIFAYTEARSRRRIWRRLAVVLALVLLLHVIFFLVIAPRLEFERTTPERTEVVQISPQQLEALKKKIMKDKHLPPLLRQELHEEYKTKEAPDDARMMGEFNQRVPKEKIAGPQADQPLQGGGGGRPATKTQPKERPREKLDLSKLGLGTKVPKPIPQTQQGPPGPQGPRGPERGPHRPMGRDDKNLERGDENLLNAVESKFYSFFVRLEEPIVKNWFFLLRSNDSQIRGEMMARKIPVGAELPITIEFVLDRQGNFRKIDVVESSTLPTLDQVTAQAVKKLGALPNPPPDLFEGGQYYTRRLRFMVHITDQPFVDNRPDLSW